MATKSNYGWLQGRTVKKGGNSSSNPHSRSITPQVQSTSSTIFGGGIKDPSGRTSEYFVRHFVLFFNLSMDDQCPVCKSDRYLNPKLRLLVSSCESCIDRLFTLGPAPCPICNKVLRKLAFSPQTFEDLGVEKEVAVRRRIAKEFNKRLEDFDNLRLYNDYLQDVEEIAFNLVNNIDLPATEARIAAYKAANAAITSLNIQREEAEALALKEQEELQRREREAQRELIDKLETSQKDAHKIVAKSRVAAAKRSSARAASSNANSGILGMAFGAEYTKLLKTRTTKANNNVPDVPHVPLQDDWYAYEDLYTVRAGGYDDFFSDAVRKDREGIMRAGGYRVEEAWNRALLSAVAGLDIMTAVWTSAQSQSKPLDVDVVMESV
ncbi:CDK-activating kinase assembly factor [Gymnopus androsaceus JB14]|uniref:RNA polymerase II transcription factor B subunit 3 n=1 Tax=Gymnopus androsaceus JB14 TaxID=1447944 RepID=A0A6A4HBB6_9AGAR|nr:CDK-activating kinase assembly factor [Gymnopus androsaceus JB14]